MGHAVSVGTAIEYPTVANICTNVFDSALILCVHGPDCHLLSFVHDILFV